NKLASENIVCCILTASDSELIYNSLNRLGLAKYFKFIYSCIGSNYDKNSIDIYNIILDKLNVKEEECYIFEDALYALNTIKDTKFKVYAIYDEYNKDDWTNINNLDINTLNEWSEFYE
ncbi:MAG: HAD family hydrolase, partial [Erysipelotrichaceae bacterium]